MSKEPYSNYPRCDNYYVPPEHWGEGWERDPNFLQTRWLDRMRERLAILLAPWACHNDLVEWYRRGRP